LWVGPLVVYLATLILAYAGHAHRATRRGLGTDPLAMAVALRKLGVITPPIASRSPCSRRRSVPPGLRCTGVWRRPPDPASSDGIRAARRARRALGGSRAGIVARWRSVCHSKDLLVLAAAVILATHPAGGACSPFRRRRARTRSRGHGRRPARDDPGRSQLLRRRTAFAAPTPDLHILYSGTTIHGRETFQGPYAGEPLSYYHRAGPASAKSSLRSSRSTRRCGSGRSGWGRAIAAYGRYGDTYQFFEIDPTVVSIARDPASFTLPRRRPRRASTLEIEDGRLGLESTPDGAYDLLVLDAFSSDAVPVHLLTVESMATAMRTGRAGGVIAVHISNRFLDLEPIVAAAAKANGFVSIIGSDLPAR
jgi:hypothetical protein